MRNLKKLLAVIMVVAMLASIMVPALAADNETVAKQLQDLGLFRGYSDTELGLGDYLTREQALAFMLRVMGLEDEALAMSKEEVTENMALVVDPETVTPTWAQPYVAYGIKTGLVKGIDASIAPKVKFDGQRVISGQEFVRFIMNGLGYTEDVVSWNEVMGKAVEVGLLSANKAIALVQEGALTRGDVVPVLASALTATTIEGITLAERLIESGDVDEAKLIEYGYFTPSPTPTEAPVEFAVEEVYALNLKQIAIVFSKPVDEDTAEDDSNYSLDGEYVLQDDGVTVIGTLKTAAANQSSKKLTIKDVEDLDGYAIAKTEVEIDFLDMTIPEVESAEVVGKDTIKVTFSEPLNVDGASNSALRKGFSLKDSSGKSVYVNKVEFDTNNTVARVTFYSDFKEGVYTLTVNNEYKDYAGYTVVKKSIDLEVVPDKEGPVVVGYESAKPYEVTLILNEDIAIVNSSLTDKDGAPYFYHTNSKNGVSGLGKKGEIKVTDGNKLKFIFTEEDKNEMPAGTVYVYIAKGAIKDLWGNKNEQQIMVAVEVEGDNEAPYVEKVEATSQNELKVTFNEKLQPKSAQDRTNYTLLDKNGKEIKNIIRSATLDEKVVKLSLREDITGEHTLVVEGVKDQYKNEMSKQSITFSVEDKTAPKFPTKATLREVDEVQTVILDFEDVMATEGVYSVLDAEKYVATLSKYDKETKKWSNSKEIELSDIDDGLTISVSDDGKKVEIELDTEDAGYKFVENGYIKVARVADAAGNKTEDLSSGNIYFTAVGEVAADKFEAVAKDELRLTLKAPLADFAEEDYVIEATTTHNNKTVSYEFGDIAVNEERNSKGNSVIVFRLLDDELNADGTITWKAENGEEVTANVTVKLNNAKDYKIVSKDAYGAVVEFDAMTAADKIKPSLVKNGITARGNEITLKFDEKVTTDNKDLAATDFIVEANGDKLKAGNDYVIEIVTTKGEDADKVKTDEIKIILIGDYEKFDGNVVINTADTVTYIKDVKVSGGVEVLGDNVLDAIEDEDVDVETAPTVASIVYGRDFTEIVITFDEEMDAATITDISNYEFTDIDGSESNKVKINNATITDDKDKVVKLFLSGAAANGDTIKLTDKITDYAGTKLVPITFKFEDSEWKEVK